MFEQIKTKEELKKRNTKIDEDVLNEVSADRAAELLPPDRDIAPEELVKLVEDITARTKKKHTKRTV